MQYSIKKKQRKLVKFVQMWPMTKIWYIELSAYLCLKRTQKQKIFYGLCVSTGRLFAISSGITDTKHTITCLLHHHPLIDVNH